MFTQRYASLVRQNCVRCQVIWKWLKKLWANKVQFVHCVVGFWDNLTIKLRPKSTMFWMHVEFRIFQVQILVFAQFSPPHQQILGGLLGLRMRWGWWWSPTNRRWDGCAPFGSKIGPINFCGQILPNCSGKIDGYKICSTEAEEFSLIPENDSLLWVNLISFISIFEVKKPYLRIVFFDFRAVGRLLGKLLFDHQLLIIFITFSIDPYHSFTFDQRPCFGVDHPSNTFLIRI